MLAMLNSGVMCGHAVGLHALVCPICKEIEDEISASRDMITSLDARHMTRNFATSHHA